MQAFEGLDSLEAVLVRLEGLVIGHRGLTRVGDMGFKSLGQRQQHLDPSRRIRLDFGLPGQNADQILPPGFLAIEVSQRGHGAHVVGLPRLGLLGRGDGVVSMVQGRVVPTRDLDPQVSRLFRVLHALGSLRVFGQEIGPLVGDIGQPFQLPGYGVA